MTLREHLNQFYKTYNIPAEGGVNDKTFEVPLPLFTLTLPNFPWRKSNALCSRPGAYSERTGYIVER